MINSTTTTNVAANIRNFRFNYSAYNGSVFISSGFTNSFEVLQNTQTRMTLIQVGTSTYHVFALSNFQNVPSGSYWQANGVQLVTTTNANITEDANYCIYMQVQI